MVLQDFLCLPGPLQPPLLPGGVSERLIERRLQQRQIDGGHAAGTGARPCSIGEERQGDGCRLSGFSSAKQARPPVEIAALELTGLERKVNPARSNRCQIHAIHHPTYRNSE